jgi:hypothetical protein
MTSNFNRCELENPFEKFGIDIKNPYRAEALVVSDDDYKNIDAAFSLKNLILPTHYFSNINNINLPRLVGVKLCSTELTPLFYILLWIKRWSQRHSNIGHELDILNCTNESLKMIEGSNKIFNRGYHYAFEKPALRLGMNNSTNLSSSYFYNYKALSRHASIGWHPFNIDKLFLNTRENIEEFSNLFNMSLPINAEDIEQYHYTNIQLVETNFNKSYSELISNNWLLELREWVKYQCPDAYSI